MIYVVVQEGDEVYAKIGKTEGDPSDIGAIKNRLSGLQVGTPHLLSCIAVTAGYSDEEQQLHYRFGAHRHRGEWFIRCAEVNAWIDTIRLETPIMSRSFVGPRPSQPVRPQKPSALQLLKPTRKPRTPSLTARQATDLAAACGERPYDGARRGVFEWRGKVRTG